MSGQGNALHFSWASAVDPKHPTLTYRIYENGALAVKDLGANETHDGAQFDFTLLMGNRPDNNYEYTMTSFDPTVADGADNDWLRESAHSNAVVIAYTSKSAPQPPKLLKVELVA